MEKVCAMAGTIFNPEKPKQSINELKAAGIGGIMFDFGLFASAEGILLDRKRDKPEFKPELAKKIYKKVKEQFTTYEFLPSIARAPFVNVQIDFDNLCKNKHRDGSRSVSNIIDINAELNHLVLQIDTDCIKACEEMGCSTIIVHPLFAGVERGKEWEINREFYLTLASQCKRNNTKILLTNLCRNQNGHLVRGICSDGVTAAEWVDMLNKEAGMERFGFCLDVGNGNLCGQDMQSMAAAVGKRIHAVILTENDGHNMAKLLPFTNAYGHRSTMDWLGVIRGLRHAEFDGYLILEMVDTIISFSPLLQPCLVPVYKALLDYFMLQINIENDLRKYEQVVLFGAGNMCRNYMKCYGEKYPPLFTCDNNPKLWDREFEGLVIKNPEELKKLPESYGVIICNIFYSEIETQLRSMGIKNIGYFNDEYMPSFYFDRLKREEKGD